MIPMWRFAKVLKKGPFFFVARACKRRLADAYDMPRYHIMRRIAPRRFHAFCIGEMKTGTNSIAGLLEAYRSRHEPWRYDLMHWIVRTETGSVNERQIARHFAYRDRKLYLEMESSHLLSHFLPTLVRLFPSARFILTVRDCYSWLNSVINQELNVTLSSPGKYPEWEKIMYVYFRSPAPSYPTEERVLVERGLSSLRNYWVRWSRSIRHALATVPADRLLTVRTHEIARDSEQIAQFLGVPPAALIVENSHLNRKKRDHQVLKQILPTHLDAVAGEHCGDLMRRFFPEIRGARDALGDLWP